MPEMVTPTAAAAARAATRAVYCGRTAAGIVAAIEEMRRRQAVRK